MNSKKRNLPIILSAAALALAAGAGVFFWLSQKTDPQSGTSNTANPQPTSNADFARYGISEEDSRRVLARVGENEITVADFIAAIERRGPFLAAQYNTPERKREFLEQMIRFELMAHDAHEKGFADLPEVQRVRKQAMIRRFLEEEFDKRISPSDIREEELRAFYDSHQPEFHTEAQVRISHILVADERTARLVITQLRTSPPDMSTFRGLCERYTRDAATRDRFGDLGFFSQPVGDDGGLPPNAPRDQASVSAELSQAAFALQNIGDISLEPIRTADGFHVIKLTGKRGAMNRSFDDVKNIIRNRLWRERREQAVADLITRLRGASDVEVHAERLSNFHPPTSATQPSQPTSPSTGPTTATAPSGVPTKAP